MHYLDEGRKNATPVLLLHGNPTWSYFYRHLIPTLKKRYRCIAPDHIGMGRSSRPSAREYEFTLARRLSDLSTLIDTLAPKQPIHLVVHDWGGMIGLAWAVQHPQRVGSLVVLNSAAFPLPRDASLPWSLQLARVPLLGKALVCGLNLFCLGALRYCVHRTALSQSERAAYLLPYRNWSARLAVHRFITDIPLGADDPSWELVQETASGLAQLADKATLLAWGMRDFVFNAAFLAEWQRHFPKAEVHRFADAGHYILEDERVILPALIGKFLAEHQGSGSDTEADADLNPAMDTGQNLAADTCPNPAADTGPVRCSRRF